MGTAGGAAGERLLAEEIPVAIVADGSTWAVLMATPADLEDLAVGFLLTEGVIATPDEIAALALVEQRDGVEARLWLAAAAGVRLAERRRAIVGPTGCGLCGVESLAQAVRPPPCVAGGPRFAAADVRAAMAALAGAQTLGATTRAVHAAALWTPAEGLVALREDVGRHNALDKLAGALLRAGRDAAGGIVALTSRVSVEMVDKAARLGAPVVAAISAPTALAVAQAKAAGQTLVAVARADGFELFSGAERIVFGAD